jgi:hypothetical protein
MGMTVGCAVCHDHKFDPISQKDFYSLSAFFNNTTQAAKDGNIKDTPPIVVVPAAMDRPRWDNLQGEMTGLRNKLDARKRAATPEFEKWLASVKPEDLKAYVPQEGLALRAALNEGKGKSVKVIVNDTEREVTREAAITWAAGRDSKQKVLSLQTTPALEIADAGDFEADHGFTTSVWVKLGRRNQTGAIATALATGGYVVAWTTDIGGQKDVMFQRYDSAGNALGGYGDLRGTCPRLQHAATRTACAGARQVRSTVRSAGDRSSGFARHYCDRTSAGACIFTGPFFAAKAPAQLLGLFDARLLCTRSSLSVGWRTQ